MSTALQAGVANRFRSLRHKNFRLFWSGQLVSLIGTWMQSVSQGWLMHRLTDSPLMLGLLGFSQFVPVTALSLWAGEIVDRIDKRRLILITQTLAMLQAFALAILAATHVIQPGMLLILASVFGAISAFDLPARQSFLVEMVGKEDLSNAIALNSAAFNAARVVGPAFAGVLLAVAGETTCFFVNALSYVVVIVMLLRMEVVSRPRADALARRPLIEGVQYALDVASIRNLLLLLGVTCGLGFQYMTLLPVFARQILHAGPRAYGLMVASFGLGSLLSALWLTRHQDRWTLRRNLLVGLSVAGVGMGVFAWSRWLPLTLLMGFAAGYGLILYVASTNMLLQLTTDDRFRGNVQIDVVVAHTTQLLDQSVRGEITAGTPAP